MGKSRFSGEQIIHILREAAGGQTAQAVCARHNLSLATFYGWKRKYGGMAVDEARRLWSLEDENGRLKRLVADQAVQIQILKEVNAKSGEPVAEAAGGPDDRGRWSGHDCAGMPGTGAGAVEFLPPEPARGREPGDHGPEPKTSALRLPADHGAAAEAGP